MGAYEEIKCPECNGEMISRTGKFGVFWGCKKFPECKGTRDSEGRSKQDRQKWKEAYDRDSEWNRNKEDNIHWNKK
jgi:ssDNA-binding Zn-finger/Zn-ribbon topoisomerase 1